MSQAPKKILGNRYEIEQRIGAGGAGTIFRARDTATGNDVVVKLLQHTGHKELGRFEREAEVLAKFRHPRVVSYVAHGWSEDNQPYLVMEWLDGEDLSARLRRAPLSDAESVRLVTLVASALASVHAQGVVHRDIKPSNLFLPGGRLDEVKLIDFGLARFSEDTFTLTSLDVAVGTPGYMAPEQVRGERGVDSPADVFALGCVLFRCLTGQAPFVGDDVIAVLAKIVLEEPPMLRELRPDLPERLEALVAWMLHKSPSARPTDAQLARALQAVAYEVGDAPRPQTEATTARVHLTATEQRLCSVLLVDAADMRGDAPVGHDHSAARDALLVEALRAYGATLSRIVDGTRVIVLTGAGAATDQAARAARCALAIRSILPTAPLALATGRGVVNGPRILGEAIDRAAALIEHLPRTLQPGAGRIWIDELTAGLLGAGFHTLTDDGRHVLLAEVEPAGAPGLMGRRTPCVGRQQELAMLDGVFEKTVFEPTAQAIVVTASAGVGKSRLLHEFLERRRADAAQQPFELWIAQGDPMRVGAPFGLLAEVVKRAAGITDFEPLDTRRTKLLSRVAAHVAPEHQRRVAEFLGAMVGTQFPDEESVLLRAARHNNMLMGDQIRRAWIDLVEAECRAQPVLLVLEDLHWGDALTVELVDATLRLLHDLPLMVVALARPELDERFPDLWRGRSCTTIRLSELSRRACEALVKSTLGSHASAATIARLFEGSAGNAFFLEELLRAAIDGRHDHIPGTVIAMVQSRLSDLAAVPRLLLRAGSVLGGIFWRGALAALLGQEVTADTLDASLAELERREWIVRRPSSSYQGEREYTFRHALVREAAYGMLTNEDRVLGHRLAGSAAF